MALRDIVDRIVGNYGDERLFKISSDSDGLLLTLPEDLWNRCKSAGASSNLLNQYIHLQMLQEEGVAEKIGNGFLIEIGNAVRLEDDLRHLLQAPDPWPGRFEAEFSGNTTRPDYRIRLTLVDPLGRREHAYRLKGPLLYLTENEVYLPNEEQWLALDAIQSHRGLAAADRGEYRNLLAISRLQQARSRGLPINLGHFEKIEAVEPESVSVSVDVDRQGNARLTPAFKDVSPEEVENRLQQFSKEDRRSFRVQSKILLMNEKKLKAVQEILENRTIPKEQLDTFLKTPTAFLDAALVDLDVGFSQRVQGITTEFTHAYFGETDASGIDWFAAHIASGSVQAPSEIERFVKDKEDLKSFREKVDDARRTGASRCAFKNRIFDISDREAVTAAVKNVAATIEKLRVQTVFEDQLPPEDAAVPEQEKSINIAIGIAKNDDAIEFGGDLEIQDALYSGHISWERYKREPFSYQREGVRWLLGLSAPTHQIDTDSLGKFGGLLADDMGLGKTYMSLISLGEYLQHTEKHDSQARPVLVVAPLSLLENWKDEVEKTYADSPFDSIVTLQSDADLRKFRIRGGGKETSQQKDTGIEEVRYALKVGPEYALQRLDQPKRLVLTTYQTLRDYQFSLARIDWSFVIFDEAQHIKNPNTLATIAAKATKAHFKLMVTGTPVENSLKDFWCLMDTARPGHLGAYQDFRKKYVNPIAEADHRDKPEVRLKVGRQLRQDVGALMLRRLKEEQLDGLPRKTVFTGGDDSTTGCRLDLLRCVMTDRQRESYDTVVDLAAEQQESESKTNSVLAALRRLRDVSLHPALIEGGGLPLPRRKADAEASIAESGKLSALLKLLREIQSRNEKAILFLINKKLQAFLKLSLEKLFGIRVSIVNGDTKAITGKHGGETRKSLIADFEAATGFGVIIMSPIAAGTGLNIVGANNVIHLERHWNPAVEAQATDRVYRIGQKRNVNVYLPILHYADPNSTNVVSFDQNLDRLMNIKIALKDAVVTPVQIDPQALGDGLFDKEMHSAVEHTRTYRPEDLKQLSWQQFEAFIAELLARRCGGEAMLTQKGSDRGGDVIIRLKDKNAILVQVKHTVNEKLDSEMPLREVYAAKQSYSEAMGLAFSAVVATNAKKIALRVKKRSKTFSVEIIAFKELCQLMKQHQVTEKDVFCRLSMERYKIS